MLSVGETLKRARLEQGLDLSTVAERTKISQKYLEAIESDDRKMLPGAFFYKNFVEQYAKSLSVDPNDIEAKLNRVLSVEEPPPLPGFESVAARNVPPITSAYRFHTGRSYGSVAALALVVVGCSGIYAWWHAGHSFAGIKGTIARLFSPAKPGERAASQVAQSKTTDTSAQVTRQSPNAESNPAPQQTALQQTASQQMPAQSPPAPAAPPAIASPNPNTAQASSASAPSSDHQVMLNLMAREATWLSVSSDGKPVFSGTLQANETKSVESKQFAKVRVGNAAGIEVRLNGRLLAPLGARGQVLVVLFTRDNFQIVSPPRESD